MWLFVEIDFCHLVLSAFELELLRRSGQNILPLSSESEFYWVITFFFMVSFRSVSGWLSASWSSVNVGWCSRTATLNIKVNPLQDEHGQFTSQSGPVRQQTWIQTWLCAVTSRELFTSNILRTWLSWRSPSSVQSCLQVRSAATGGAGSRFMPPPLTIYCYMVWMSNGCDQ